MDAKYLNAFLESLQRVLTSFGAVSIKKTNVQIKENMSVDMDITSVVGLIGKIRGNVAYSFSLDTAKRIVSSMMGASIAEMDAMGRSAIAELTNMITASASIMLSGKEMAMDITPPSIIFGKEMLFIISAVPAITIDIETSFGNIQVNIGLEI